ncbi:MAG: bacillithiol biosynthesis deacetylase BshB1 [Ignavibacteriales bacterium]|nr:bacillithiol biosynthesis deacetylase BshB1 [Ignavibacteriales bacterium]
MIDILAIGAHPDDLELSCGATLAKLARRGHSVVLADLTQGERGTRGTAEIRTREAHKAASILGIKERRNLGLPDGNLERNTKNVRQIIAHIRDLRPRMLIFPHSFDRHPDHMHTHELCREAWFYSGLAKIPTEINGASQQPHRPDIWFEFMQWHEFEPSIIVDVTESWDVKMNAVRAYESQLHSQRTSEPETKLSSPQFLDLIEARGRAYGERIGVRYGEPFHCPVPLGIHDLFDLVHTKG